MYHVLENNKPAILPSMEIWSNNKFGSFEKAVQYANDYLGQFGSVPENWNGDEYDYGHGDFISIKLVRSEKEISNAVMETVEKLLEKSDREYWENRSERESWNRPLKWNRPQLAKPSTPVATLSFLIPGTGQLFNKTYVRAILFFILWVIFWLNHWSIGWFSVMIISASDAFIVCRKLKFKQLLEEFDVSEAKTQR